MLASLFSRGLTRCAALVRAVTPPTTTSFLLNNSKIRPVSAFGLDFIVRGMANHRHKKMLKLAKGYRGRANSCFTIALHRVKKARQYAYRDRKVQRRNWRKLFIMRINASSRMYGLPYNLLINYMMRSNIELNRNMLANLAINEPLSFRSVLDVCKQAPKLVPGAKALPREEKIRVEINTIRAKVTNRKVAGN